MVFIELVFSFALMQKQ